MTRVMLEKNIIYEYPFHKPEHNFPNREIQQNPEAEFAKQFSRCYQRKFLQVHSRTSKQKTLFIREVPVSGSGIADLLVFSWADYRGNDLLSAHKFKDMAPFGGKVADKRPMEKDLKKYL